MRTRWIAGAGLCLMALCRSALAQDSGSVQTAVVTYLTATSAYVNAGRDAGLREGATIQVVRGGSVIATLKVSFLASHQASCDIVSETVPIAVGDSVRYRAVRLASPPPAAAVAANRPPPSREIARSAPLRGRVGAHYLVIAQGGGGGTEPTGFTQPSLDVRLDGRPSPGTPLAVTVDVRARRTVTNPATGSTIVDGHARAYQLAVSWNPDRSPQRVTLGRQVSTAISSVGLFDGISVERNTPRWSAGVFAGTQPDPHDLGFSTDIVGGGAFVQRRAPRDARGRQWSATLGVSGSYEQGHANREFAFLQASFSSRRVMTLVTQELDYYRPWKRDSGMAAISFTSTFAMLRVRASDGVDLVGGFDNRRNVLLYRDFVNPVTTFDDTFRQGIWAGAAFRFGGRYSGGLEIRRSSGGSAGSAGAYTASLGADRLVGGRIGIGIRGRGTYYYGPTMDGWLYSAALGGDPAGGRLHLELSGGARIEHDQLAIPETATITWIGTDLDVNLTRALYLLVSASMERGGSEPLSQLYTGCSVRF